MKTEAIKARQFLRDEQDGAALYEGLAAIEADTQLSEVYRRLAATERHHAELWIDKLKQAGLPVPPFRPSWRTRTLLWVARRFGAEMILPTVASMEDGATGRYAGMGTMQREEKFHARLLRQLTVSAPRGVEGTAVARLEGRHRAVGGNALRAAVLGANDGLVSNLSLVMGVAGAQVDAHGILVTGLAGLLAGACAMGMGEWISVQSAREAFAKQIATEKEEIATSPAEEAEELALIYQARGMPAERARELADHILADPTTAIETLAREELGVDTKELGGSAWVAAITSFLLFAAGALLPVVPFMLLKDGAAVATSIAGSVAGLFVIGAGITLFTGRSVVASGLRMVAFGLGAAALTFGLGHVIGASLAG